jgi:poly(hydroxyalkanoate) granule-associated protein
MSNTIRLSVPQAGDAVLAASRQVWLATLGAAAVTREWAAREGASAFRTLVKEGSAVESQAIRRVGKHVQASVRQATTLVNGARSGVRTSVESLAGAASAAVSTVLRTLPTVQASDDIERVQKRAQTVAKPARRTKHRAVPRVASKRRSAKSAASK